MPRRYAEELTDQQLVELRLVRRRCGAPAEMLAWDPAFEPEDGEGCGMLIADAICGRTLKLSPRYDGAHTYFSLMCDRHGYKEWEETHPAGVE